MECRGGGEEGEEGRRRGGEEGEEGRREEGRGEEEGGEEGRGFDSSMHVFFCLFFLVDIT